MSKRTRASKPARTPHVVVAPRLKESLRLGHPWVYRDAVERAPDDLQSGAWVRVQCANLQFYGLWDAASPIAIRLFSRQRVPNAVWILAQVESAWAVRSPLRDPSQQTSAFRWLFGESDGLPGVVVDYYRDVKSGAAWAVLRTYAASVQRIKSWVVQALVDTTSLSGVIERSDAGVELLVGELPPAEIVMAEHGLRFAVDLLRGQKTGFFLDQRANRATVEWWSEGKSVLNLFSYTGGFSVYAARGGATQITSVDSAPAAIETASRNFVLNGFDPKQHEFVVADCFDLLAKYHGEGRRFDLIVVDPPSFARAKAQLPGALKAYQRLNTLAINCLLPDGLLVSSSCTSQISPPAFRQMLAASAADARRTLRILHEAGQPLDHPVRVGFPEGRYLKFILGMAMK